MRPADAGSAVLNARARQRKPVITSKLAHNLKFSRELLRARAESGPGPVRARRSSRLNFSSAGLFKGGIYLGYEPVHVGLRNQAGSFAEVLAEPAHNHRSIGQLSVLEQFFHPNAPPLPLLGLANAVAMPGFGHVDPSLFSANTPRAHGLGSFPCSERLSCERERIAKA